MLSRAFTNLNGGVGGAAYEPESVAGRRLVGQRNEKIFDRSRSFDQHRKHHGADRQLP